MKWLKRLFRGKKKPVYTDYRVSIIGPVFYEYSNVTAEDPDQAMKEVCSTLSMPDRYDVKVVKLDEDGKPIRGDTWFYTQE